MNSKQYEKLCGVVNVIPTKIVLCNRCGKPMVHDIYTVFEWQCTTYKCGNETDSVLLEQSDYSCVLPEFTLEKFHAFEELLADRIGYMGEYKKLSNSEWVFHYPFEVFPSRKDALCNLMIRLLNSGVLTEEQVKEIIEQ